MLAAVIPVGLPIGALIFLIRIGKAVRLVTQKGIVNAVGLGLTVLGDVDRNAVPRTRIREWNTIFINKLDGKDMLTELEVFELDWCE